MDIQQYGQMARSLSHLAAGPGRDGVYMVLLLCNCLLLLALVILLCKRPVRKRKGRGWVSGRAYLEIDLDNLTHNAAVLKAAMPPSCQLMAVTKAEAYGHGMYEAAVHLNRIGVKAFAVATMDEGIQMRRYGVSGEILILGYTPPARAKQLRKFDLTQTIISREHALQLSRQGQTIKAHIKIDTGMHRLGFDVSDFQDILCVFSMPHIQVQGIFTHLCVADSLQPGDVDFTRGQIQRFYGLLHRLAESGVSIPKVHIQSSYGLLNYPELKCDYVRAGIALYGILSAPEDQTKLQLDLKPVLSLKSQVVLVRQVRAGDTVGYGRAFTAEKDSTIAMVPIGYADGLPRCLSCGRGAVLVNGRLAPIAGRICMDQMAVDVTGIEDVKPGTVVTLIGRDADAQLTTPEVAAASGSISNELLSRMGRRLEIVVRRDS